MAFRITHDDTLALVELTFTDSITTEDLRVATNEAIAIQKQGGALDFIVDAGAVDLKASLVDVYQLPARYWEQGVDKRTRIAVIFPVHEKAREGARFYEDACRNRGWNARVLPDRQAAMQWLGKSR